MSFRVESRTYFKRGVQRSPYKILEDKPKGHNGQLLEEVVEREK